MIWLGALLAGLFLAIAFLIAWSRRPAATQNATSSDINRYLRRPIRGTLPEIIAFIDLETTGLYERNRIVSFAAIKVCVSALIAGASIECLYLIFDPEEDSHPKAQKVHGFSDWDLMHQEKFSERANEIIEFLKPVSLVVAHNVEFDFGFLAREFERCGLPPLPQRLFCTMEAFRAIHPGKSASLDSVAAMAGGWRLGVHHRALEDAALVMRVFFWMHGRSVSVPLGETLALKPSNWRPVPNKPDPPPTPRSSLWADLPQAEFFGALASAVNKGDLSRAEDMLLSAVQVEEFRSYGSRYTVRYRPYFELAKLYYKTGRIVEEVAIIRRCVEQSITMGPGPEIMHKRLKTAEKRLAKVNCSTKSLAE